MQYSIEKFASKIKKFELDYSKIIKQEAEINSIFSSDSSFDNYFRYQQFKQILDKNNAKNSSV